MKKVILLIIFQFSISLSFSQSRCGTDEYFQYLLLQNPSLIDSINNSTIKYESAKTNTILSDEIIYIPVVVHVIQQSGNSATNISDAQIYSQINVLNQDFNIIQGSSGLGATTKILFCLAQQDANGNTTTGITRHSSSDQYFIQPNTTPSEEAKIKSFDPWPSTHYLNIWVCDIRKTNLTDMFFGYSTFPWASAGNNDGVVINYNYFGNMGTGASNSDFNKGKTTTHEVGHWCGLWHTFNPNPFACANNDCNIAGDQVCDTDPVDGGAWNDPLINLNSANCSQRNNCSNQTISAENYMDYNFDNCLSFFTQGQKDRMRIMLEQHRNYIFQASITNPGALPTACSQIVTTPPSGSGGSGTTTFLKPNQGFFLNGSIKTEVTICQGDAVVIDFKQNDTIIRVPNCWTSLPCGQDPDCGWLAQLIGICDCGENLRTYWVSVYYNCDQNFNCTSEKGQWFHYNGYLDYIYVDVGQSLSFTFATGGYYKIKLATDTNCHLSGGWIEGVKNIYISPQSDITFINSNNTPPFLPLSSIPNGTYRASNTITIQNSNVASGSNISMVAGNSIVILPNTTISSNFEARIENHGICSPLPSDLSSNRLANDSGKHYITKIKYYNNKTSLNISKNADSSSFFTNSVHPVDPSSENSINLSPNPTTGRTVIYFSPEQITSATARLEITDVIGKKVFEKNPFGQGVANYIDLSHLQKGVYILKISTEDEVRVEKVVIE